MDDKHTLQAIASQLIDISKHDEPLHEHVDQLCDLSDQLSNLVADTMIDRYTNLRAPLFPGDKPGSA